MKIHNHTGNILKLLYILLSLGVIYLSTTEPTAEKESFLAFLPFSNHPLFDKFLHFSMYTIHTSLSLLIFRSLFIGIMASFQLSLAMEIVQYYLPYRSFEFYDLVANLMGCLFSALIFKIVLKDRFPLRKL